LRVRGLWGHLRTVEAEGVAHCAQQGRRIHVTIELPKNSRGARGLVTTEARASGAKAESVHCVASHHNRLPH
jgi:hypothetical protein